MLYKYKEIIIYEYYFLKLKGVFTMNIDKSIYCPLCDNNDFLLKYEATYIYTYKINASESKAAKNNVENLPFLFDKRDISSSRQYIECVKCRSKYPCSFEPGSNKIDFTILRKAIRSDHTNKPEFWG